MKTALKFLQQPSLFLRCRGSMRLTWAILAVVPICTQAQSSVNSSGGSGSTATSKVSWSVGQPVNSTVTGGGKTLTQGFQQPWADISTVVGENAGTASDIKVFPNPTQHMLNVEMPGATGKDQLELLDAAGRIILQANTTGDRTELDLTSYGAGNYFLRVRNSESMIVRTFKINVTH